ncbi:MAG: hypothetical protein V1792_11165 [Pseudomonadota bacterium]
MAKTAESVQQIDLIDLLKDPNVAKLYINGLTVGLSLSDVFMVVNSGPMPVAVVQMSFTTAKTMMQTLSQLINDFEKQTEQPLLTMHEINQKCFGGKNE